MGFTWSACVQRSGGTHDEVRTALACTLSDAEARTALVLASPTRRITAYWHAGDAARAGVGTSTYLLRHADDAVVTALTTYVNRWMYADDAAMTGMGTSFGLSLSLAFTRGGGPRRHEWVPAARLG